MNRLGLIRTSCTALDSLMLAACTKDEATDGKYSLQISYVQVVNSPQTRIAESADGKNSSWSWDGTEQIGVKFYDETVIYILKIGKVL